MRFSSPRLVCLAAVLGGLARWATPARGDDIYVISRTNTDSTISKISNTGAVSVVKTMPGLAVDPVINSKGDLFFQNIHTNEFDSVSNRFLSDIVQMTGNGTLTTLIPGRNKNAALAVDAHDQLFMADDTGLSRVNSDGTMSTLLSARLDSSRLAFDADDQIFLGSGIDGSIGEVVLSKTAGSPIMDLEVVVLGQRSSSSLTHKISLLIKSVFGNRLKHVDSMAFGPDGNLYVGSYDERDNHVSSGIIFRVTPDGGVSKFAELATTYIGTVAFDSTGTLYASDNKNIYKVSDKGVFTPIYTSPILIDGFAISPGLKLKPVKFVPPNDTWMYVGVAVLFWLLVAAWWWFSRRRTARRAKNLA